MEPLEPAPSPVGGDRFERACAGLTPAQRLAVDSTAGALSIVAGAGSGKTRVLTLRVARRIRDRSADADHTLVCTFTRKASRELRDRLGHYGVPVSTPAGPGRVPTPGVRAGTIHQLALTLLRRRASDRGGVPPALVEHRWRLLTEVTGNRSDASTADTEIGWAKARCLDPDGYGDAAVAVGRSMALPATQVAEIYSAYQDLLARRGLLDLDDVLLRAADLLDDHTFAEQAHWRYRHVAVDEFQDVNPAQFRLIEALVGDRGDLCAVGDPNQAIYGWNGSDPSLLATLPHRFGGLEVVDLDQNHRCTPQVVAAAEAALGAAAAVAPPRSAASDGPRPTVTAFDDDRAEAEAVAARVLSRAEAGMAWSDQAVLARTHDLLAGVRRAFDEVGIPCRFAPAPESPDTEAPGPATGRAAARTRAAGRLDPGGGVELATFHRAKGLEWEAVSVVGLEDGYVPIIHATTPAALDEERRLLYVALTRAGRILECSWARSRTMGAEGRAMERRPSPWLADMSEAVAEGAGRPTQLDAAERFAELRAQLRG